MKKLVGFVKKHIVTFVKSMVIGATLRVPGMSGGTTAIILNIYDKLLAAVNNFFKNIKENLLFLCVFALGGGLAFLAFNSLIYKVTSKFPAVSAYFIVGIILFGIPALVKEAGITYKGERFLTDEKSTRRKKVVVAGLKDIIPFAAGVAVVVVIGILQNQGWLNGSEYSGFGAYVFNILAGFFAGIALVLPGLSFTYFLMVIGLMDTLSESISLSSIDPVFLITFGIGAALGLVATAKVLGSLIEKKKRGTYICVIGFLIGSVVMLLTESKNIPSINQIFFCALFFVLGAALILVATYFANYFAGRRAAALADTATETATIEDTKD